jgi:hypothetical protein
VDIGGHWWTNGSLGQDTFEAFVVNVNPTPADLLPWHSHPLKTLRELKQAVKEDRAQGLFVLQMLESLSLQLNTPKDYKDICRAVLSPGMFSTWKAMYYDEAEQQAVCNQQASMLLMAEMLQGEREYALPAVQAQGPPQYFDQVRLCFQWAWAHVPSQGSHQ